MKEFQEDLKKIQNLGVLGILHILLKKVSKTPIKKLEKVFIGSKKGKFLGEVAPKKAKDQKISRKSWVHGPKADFMSKG